MVTGSQFEQQKCQSAFIQRSYKFVLFYDESKQNFEVGSFESSVYEGYGVLGYDRGKQAEMH